MPVSIEQWTEYGIGQFVFLLRFYCRWRVVGIRNFAWDDFFSFIAMLMWISDTVTVQIISDHGAFVGLTTETANALTDEEVHNMEIGSKALFVAWLSYVTLIWSLKASVLCFYSRLTLGLWQQKFVRILVYPVILTYLASILTLFLHCTPIQKNWQIKPFAGDKCTLFVANYIVVIIGNVSTDLAILYIPLPMIWAVKIPLRRKVAISILLSSGIFVITAAILRCVLSLKDVTEVSASTIWGIRETFISLLAISAAAIKPYFSRSRWTGGSSQYLSGKNTNGGGDTTTGKLDRSDLKKGSVKISSFNNDDDDRGRFGNSSWQDTNASHSDIELGLSTMNETPSRHGSDDNIVSTPDIMSGKFPRDHSSTSNNSSWLAGSDKKKASLDKSGTSRPIEIQVTTTFIHDESGDNTPLSPQPHLRQPTEMWSPQHSGNTTMVSSSGRR